MGIGQKKAQGARSLRSFHLFFFSSYPPRSPVHRPALYPGASQGIMGRAKFSAVGAQRFKFFLVQFWPFP